MHSLTHARALTHSLAHEPPGGLPRAALSCKIKMVKNAAGKEVAKAELVSLPDPVKGRETRTLFETFKQSAENHPKAPCLGTRKGKKYVWQKYGAVRKQALDLGSVH